MNIWDHSAAGDELLEDFEELGLGDLGVVVLVDGADELLDLLLRDLAGPAEALEGVVDEVVDLVALERARLVGVVLVEDRVDRLPELVVTGLATHI